MTDISKVNAFREGVEISLADISEQFVELNRKLEKGIELIEKITADISVARLQKIAEVIGSMLDEFLTEEVKV